MPLRGRIVMVERQKEGGCGAGAGWQMVFRSKTYVRNPGPGQERQCSPSTKLITACVVSDHKKLFDCARSFRVSGI